MSRSELYLPEWDDPNNLKRLNGIKRKCDEVSWHPVKKKKNVRGRVQLVEEIIGKMSHFIFVTQWLWVLTEVVTKSNVVLLIFTGEWFDQFWVRQAGENDSNSSKEITMSLFFFLNWGITRTQKSIQIVKCRAPWILMKCTHLCNQHQIRKQNTTNTQKHPRMSPLSHYLPPPKVTALLISIYAG